MHPMHPVPLGTVVAAVLLYGTAMLACGVVIGHLLARAAFRDSVPAYHFHQSSPAVLTPQPYASDNEREHIREHIREELRRTAERSLGVHESPPRPNRGRDVERHYGPATTA